MSYAIAITKIYDLQLFLALSKMFFCFFKIIFSAINYPLVFSIMKV